MMDFTEEALFDDRLQCYLLRATIDLVNHTALIEIAHGNSAHGPGAIDLATTADPRCQRILIIAGGALSTIYRRDGKKWTLSVVDSPMRRPS